MRISTAFIISIIMALGIAVSGFFIKDGLVNIRSSDRFVTVKGLAERDVKSDLAVLPIQFKVANDDLVVAQQEMKRQEQAVRNFMQKHGIAADEIKVQQIRVVDALANQYRPEDIGVRYTIDVIIDVRTNNVDAVATAAQTIGDLVADGVLIGYGVWPQFSFTKLNDIKPEMLADATANAREAAQQFANDSGAKVGSIRSATQGYFSIAARDGVQAVMPDSASLYKKIRVVSTFDYYIHD